MAQIKRTTDESGSPTWRYAAALEHLAKQILSGKCLAFLGAGASVDPTKEDLPTAVELSKSLAERCRLEWHEYIPLSTVAFYYEFFFARDSLNGLLKETIAAPTITPSRTLEKLVEVLELVEQRNQSTTIVTTNYDMHFETAYRQRLDRDPEVIIYHGAQDPNQKGIKLHLDVEDPEFWAPSGLTALYKMHGCISRATGQNLVITEEDYINFLTNALGSDPNKRLLHYVRGRMALSTILFVGYSLSDWNFRVIFKATAEGRGTRSYAVQYSSSEDEMSDFDRTRWNALVEFWAHREVDIINVDGAQFMEDLLDAARWELQRPTDSQAVGM